MKTMAAAISITTNIRRRRSFLANSRLASQGRSAQQVYEIYPVQPIGILNGQTLDRNLLDLSLEVERRLFKRLKGFAKVEYQRGHSNYVAGGDDYFARTYSGGLRLGILKREMRPEPTFLQFLSE
jgi:hypothetical protein